MKKFLLLPVVFISTFSFSQMQGINIVPQPVEIRIDKGEFLINSKTNILTVDTLSAKLLNYYIEKLYGFVLPINKNIYAKENLITFSSIHSEAKKILF